MGIDQIIKQTNDQNNNDNKDKKFDKDKILNTLKDKRMIGGGVGVVVGLMVIGMIFHHGESVKIEQGLTKDQVKQTVEETIKPLVEQQQQLEKQLQSQKEAVATATNTQNQNNQNKNNNTQQQNTQQQNTQQKPTQANTQQQATTQKPNQNHASLPNLLGLAPKPSNQLPHSQYNMPPQQASLPPLTSPVVSGKEEEVPPKPKPEMVFLTMPVPKKGYQQSNFTQTEKKSQHKKSVYIPAGSIAEGELLYGFTAPESGVLPPVVVKIIKPVWTANNWYMPFQECLITTKAQFNVSEDLANVGGNGSILSCVLPNGRVIQTKVDVAIGEDTTKNADKVDIATIGLRGKDVWLSGKELAAIASLYGLEGFANALQNIQQEQSMTAYGSVITSIKNSAEYSIAGGVAQGMNAFIQFWLKKYQDKVPAIEVAPKKVFIVFVNGARIDASPYKEELQ